MMIIQPSASRTATPRAPIPSSELLGYYHSSALRTDLLIARDLLTAEAAKKIAEVRRVVFLRPSRKPCVPLR